MTCLLRKATDTDATAISGVIVSALRESNSQDYSAAVIAQVELSFSPPSILGFIAQRQVYVAPSAKRSLLRRASIRPRSEAYSSHRHTRARAPGAR
jgi:hypothetical protein